jgi:hypothetical protein
MLLCCELETRVVSLKHTNHKHAHTTTAYITHTCWPLADKGAEASACFNEKNKNKK